MIIKKVLFTFICLYAAYSFTHESFALGNELEITPPQIQAPAAVLMDASTGLILYDRYMHETKYPASLTKLMTALMLLEYVDGDFSRRITMSRNAVFSIPRGSSHIAMNEYETLSAEESLYAIMLESANEVSNAIGEFIAQDLDTFAQMMTKRAHELGAINTNFTNAHGLHDENNYTTAYDMAIIMKELINHDKFIEVISTRVYAIPPTERQSLERMLNNSHRMIHQGQHFNEHVVGGKTGFTNEASHTLATYAEKDDIRLIAVVLQNQRLVSYTDTEILLDYGFNMFDNIEIFNSSSFNKYIDVIQNNSQEIVERGQAQVIAENNVTMQLPLNVNPENIQQHIDLPLYIQAPIRKGDIIGQLTLKYEGIVLDKVNLIANEEYEYIPVLIDINNYYLLQDIPFTSIPFTSFIGIISFIFLLYLILKIIRIRYKRKQMLSKRIYNGHNLRYSRYRYK